MRIKEITFYKTDGQGNDWGRRLNSWSAETSRIDENIANKLLEIMPEVEKLLNYAFD